MIFRILEGILVNRNLDARTGDRRAAVRIQDRRFLRRVLLQRTGSPRRIRQQGLCDRPLYRRVKSL